MPTPPLQITVAPNILAEFDLANLESAEYLTSQEIDGVSWNAFRVIDGLCVMEDDKFAVFVGEKPAGRIVFISVLPNGKATLEDTTRIARLENAIVSGEALPEDSGLQRTSIPTVFVVNYKGISASAGREAVRKGTAASRQLMRDPNFRGLILYTPSRDVASLMIDLTVKILGDRFQVAPNEEEAFVMALKKLG
jgi:hypothetical protein